MRRPEGWTRVRTRAMGPAPRPAGPPMPTTGLLTTDVTERRRAEHEQAALRRVATLVARTASPDEIFSAVTDEVGRLSGADVARMERYEPEGTVMGVAGWSRDHEQQLSVARPGEREARE